MRFFISIIIFLTLSANAWCQEVKLFKNFGVDNYLSYQFVRTIAQDKDGFMWFGSHEGLHRFDGYQFVSYHHDASVANSLSSDVISRILIDSKQRFWVGTTGGGLNLFQPQHNNFIHISSTNQSLTLSNDIVNVLFEDSQGKLWIGTEDGLNILFEQDGKWVLKAIHQELGNEKSLTHNTIHDVIETDDQYIWVGTNGGGISVFDLEGDFVRAVKFGDKNASLYTNKFVNSLFYDKNSNIWIGTIENGLLKYNQKTEQLEHFISKPDDPHSIVSNTIKTIYQDSKGDLWIATDKGLLIYQAEKNNFIRYQHVSNNPYSLSNDFILSFYEDSDNLMWIGTFTGVNRWEPSMSTFNQYSARTHQTLKNNNITNFTQFDNNNIIFSSYSSGIYQLNLSSNQISKVEFDDYFSSLRIMSLLADKQTNTLWVGTRTSGLFKIDFSTKKIKQYQHDENDSRSISANSITDIIKTKAGELWVSTFHQGLNRLNSDGTFTRYIQQNNNVESGPSTNQLLQLLQDKNGDIWIGTYGGGLNRFDIINEKFTHIKFDKAALNSLSSDLACVLLEDDEENLWVGTQAAGLNFLSAKNKRNENYQFTHFDTKDGMKSRTVYGITQDILGDIWFSSNKGISRFNTNKKIFDHFDLGHGLVDYEYNHNAVFVDDSNSIYFGSGNGFNSVAPDKLTNISPVPKIRLTSILNLNEVMSFEQPLSQLKSIELDYIDQLISFDYVGLNYASSASTKYKYRLLGFDEEWVEAGKLRRATYTNLPQGKYQLQIVAGNSDGVWSEPLKLTVIMNPAPWNTWWAYMIYATLAALLILIYSRWLNRKLIIEQQQKELLQKQVAIKTQDFVMKNQELEQANKSLELAATTDKVTGVKSRRYLDIYIEQASQLMNQIHKNLLPVQRDILPRLYILMVNIGDVSKTNNSQLVNLTDLLHYTRNNDDIVIRWSVDTFAIIGFEKENNIAELSSRLANRFKQIFPTEVAMNMAYSFYPFNREQPLDLTWDQVSVMIEKALSFVQQQGNCSWVGLCQPKQQPFNYMELLQTKSIEQLKQVVVIKQG